MVFSYFRGTAEVIDSAHAYEEPVTSRNYDIVVPLGKSGIALMGDAGKYVPLGKKRVSHLVDDGTLSIALTFAPNEGPVVLRGYAQAKPVATASVGAVGPVSYDVTTKIFTVTVTAAASAAAIAFR